MSVGRHQIVSLAGSQQSRREKQHEQRKVPFESLSSLFCSQEDAPRTSKSMRQVSDFSVKNQSAVIQGEAGFKTVGVLPCSGPRYATDAKRFERYIQYRGKYNNTSTSCCWT